MPRVDDAIAAFWSKFEEHAGELDAADSTDAPVYGELLRYLHKVDAGIYFEFCSAPGARDLIITADGNSALFPLVRNIVDAAPPIDGWTIFALKPKLGLPETTCWENCVVNLSDVVFDPLELDGSGLGLHFFVPGIEAKDFRNAHNAILRALDHGLGEEKFAAAVQYTEVRAMPAGEEVTNYIPIHDLEKFIEWRARQ